MPLSQILDTVKAVVDTLNGIVWNWPAAMPLLVIVLVGTGLVTTFRLGWIQVRRFWHGIRVLKGDYDDPEHEGDLSHFQALSTALSATIGIGNIAGVATAIHYGGPGAMFWMWVTAVFGMAIKYTECTLSMRYRVISASGEASGGPMYYIERGLGKTWKPLAVAFAAFAVTSSFGSGNSVQSFTVADQLRQDLHVPTWLTGLVVASLVAMVILGGIKRIGIVTSKLVPFMCVVYVLGGLSVLLYHYQEVVPSILLIVKSAFQPAAQFGGFAGGGFVFMLTWGVKRGLFSNESGQGSAPIAHAAAKTDEPVREGMVAMLGPFIDTLVVCSITGLVIIVTGVWHLKQSQTLPVNKQSALTAIVGSAQVQSKGVVRDGDLASGVFEVKEGRPAGLTLVRNNGTVDNLVFLVGGREILGLSPEQFTGTVTLPKAAAGDVMAASFRDASGQKIPAARMWIRGDALQNGSPLTSWAFGKGLGRLGAAGGQYIVTLAVFLFALSTIISWSYYGDRSIQYLLGDRYILPYRIVYCVMTFLGAIYSLELVWSFGDTALGLMSFPNLIAVLLLTGKVKAMTREYTTSGHMAVPKR
jgi:AGCS family alanine or glycine:cation symporter